MNRRTALGAAVTGCVFVLAWLGNAVTLQRPLAKALRADPRNQGVEVSVHYRFFVLPWSLVYDLRGLSNDKGSADVTRVLLQSAAALKERNFSRVALAYRGKVKFVLKGEYFHSLGVGQGRLGPAQTMDAVTENAYRPDGVPAFRIWIGSSFGTLSGRMNDLGEFHRQWYLAETTAALSRSADARRPSPGSPAASPGRILERARPR